MSGFKKIEVENGYGYYVGKIWSFPDRLNENNIKKEAANINGQFFLILKFVHSACYYFIADRFSSRSCFYKRENGELKFSSQISRLSEKRHLDHNSVMEFVHFQKLFGQKTLFGNILTFKAASITTYHPHEDKLDIFPYWRPDFKKNTSSLTENAIRLVELAQQASRRILKDEKTAFFLSGGLDSRFVLACSNVEKAYTIAPFKNNEYRTARRIAQVKGVSHSFIKRDDSQYFTFLEDLVEMNNGLNSLVHGHFISPGRMESMKEHTCLVHGHGIDYMFQGSYLPSEKAYFFGKPCVHSNLKRLDSLERQFIGFVKYRMKSIKMPQLLEYKYKRSFNEVLINSVASIIKDIKDLKPIEKADQWEYLNTHCLSKHYTNLNLQSMESHIPQYVLCWENEVFDFFFTLPHEQKINALILKKALLHLCPSIARVKNANLNVPAHLHHNIQNILYFSGQCLNKLGFSRFGPPWPTDRSWPDFNQILKSSPQWRGYLDSFKQKALWLDLGIFNVSLVINLIDSTLAGSANHADFIFSLITLEETLKRAQ